MRRYLECREAMARLASVQVCSHSRQRQTLVIEMTLASVPTILPSHDGHLVGRVTASAGRKSDIRAVSHRSGPPDCSFVNSCLNLCQSGKTIAGSADSR